MKGVGAYRQHKGKITSKIILIPHLHKKYYEPSFIKWMNDWMIKWLIEWLTDWLQLYDRLIDYL